jgi:hypothetical protein
MGLRVEGGIREAGLGLVAIRSPRFDPYWRRAATARGLETCTRLRLNHHYTGAIAVRIPASATSAETAEWLDRGADAFFRRTG